MNSTSSWISARRQIHLYVPKHFGVVLVTSLILLILCVLASFALGSRMVGFDSVIDGLLHQNIDSYEANIVRKRIPRTIFSLCCGGALGVSGALMQAATRNPIADQSILGVHTGASLIIVCGIAFFIISSANENILFTLVCGCVHLVFVFCIGS